MLYGDSRSQHDLCHFNRAISAARVVDPCLGLVAGRGSAHPGWSGTSSMMQVLQGLGVACFLFNECMLSSEQLLPLVRGWVSPPSCLPEYRSIPLVPSPFPYDEGQISCIFLMRRSPEDELLPRTGRAGTGQAPPGLLRQCGRPWYWVGLVQLLRRSPADESVTAAAAFIRYCLQSRFLSRWAQRGLLVTADRPQM